MNNFCTPTTYEEARRMGVYWDWNGILQTNLGDRERYIAMSLLKRGVSVERGESGLTTDSINEVMSYHSLKEAPPRLV